MKEKIQKLVGTQPVLIKPYQGALILSSNGETVEKWGRNIDPVNTIEMDDSGDHPLGHACNNCGGIDVKSLSPEEIKSVKEATERRYRRMVLKHDKAKIWGKTHKQWITFGGITSRPTHQAANAQLRPIDDHFNVGGAKLFLPSDPKAPIAETANCRCQIGYLKLDNPTICSRLLTQIKAINNKLGIIGAELMRRLKDLKKRLKEIDRELQTKYSEAFDTFLLDLLGAVSGAGPDFKKMKVTDIAKILYKRLTAIAESVIAAMKFLINLYTAHKKTREYYKLNIEIRVLQIKDILSEIDVYESELKNIQESAELFQCY